MNSQNSQRSLHPDDRKLSEIVPDEYVKVKPDWGIHKRTGPQKQEDLLVMAHMYVRGYTQEKIAEKINEMRPYRISRQQVALDIKTLHEMWREQYLAEYDTAKARELAKIDALEAEYWDGWEESKKQKEITDTEKTEDEHTGRGGKINQKYVRTKVKRRTETYIGELKFLEGIQWCIEQRCKIFGLFAPTEIDMNWRKMAAQDGFDPDEVVNVIRSQFLAATTTNVAGGGNSGSVGANPGNARRPGTQPALPEVS